MYEIQNLSFAFCPLGVGKSGLFCQHFANKLWSKCSTKHAAMTELVDVSDLKSEADFSVRVRFPLAAPSIVLAFSFENASAFHTLKTAPIISWPPLSQFFLQQTQFLFYPCSQDAYKYLQWFDKWNAQAKAGFPEAILFGGTALWHKHANTL